MLLFHFGVVFKKSSKVYEVSKFLDARVAKHSVLGLVSTFNISTIRETLFFRCGIVIRIILNAYFPPLLSLPFT